MKHLEVIQSQLVTISQTTDWLKKGDKDATYLFIPSDYGFATLSSEKKQWKFPSRRHKKNPFVSRFGAEKVSYVPPTFRRTYK